MKPALAMLVATASVAIAATDSFAQVYVAPAPQVVYRPAPAVYVYPRHVAPRVIVNRPIIYAGSVNAAPVVSTPAPVVTNYAPAVSAPVVTNYAPATSAPIVTNYAPSATPVVTASPVITAPPVIAAAPIITYRPVPLITYRQPVTYVAPTVTGYAGNVSTVYAVPVAAAPGVVVRQKVYYRGQPIRNTFRVLTP